MIGYKIMVFLDKTGMVHSLADRRLAIPPVRGTLIRGSFYGVWLGTTIEYVHQYYGSNPDDPAEHEPGEYEVRCMFSFNNEDIVSGSVSSMGKIDPGVEFAVRKAKLLSVYNVTKKCWILKWYKDAENNKVL